MAFVWSEVATPNTSGRTVNAFVWAEELGLFVGVGDNGLGTGLIITSPDGETWTIQSAPGGSSLWNGIAWNGTVLVAVGSSTNRVMTSTDALSWTLQTPSDSSSWQSVCWSEALGLFVAVANAGAGNRVMTSSDGVTWTGRAAAAAQAWQGVAASAAGLVAVSTTLTGTQPVMTSADSVTWALQTAGAANLGAINSFGTGTITYSADLDMFLFKARLQSDSTRYVLYSTDDGASWTRADFPTSRAWESVLWSDAQASFMCVAQGQFMGFSADGDTWTEEDMGSAVFRAWLPLAWSDSLGRVVSFDDSDHNAALLGILQTIGTVSPSRGTKRGGTVCTISGTNLESITSVTFGGTPATGVVAAANGLSVTCISPAHAVGAVDVELS